MVPHRPSFLIGCPLRDCWRGSVCVCICRCIRVAVCVSMCFSVSLLVSVYVKCGPVMAPEVAPASAPIPAVSFVRRGGVRLKVSSGRAESFHTNCTPFDNDALQPVLHSMCPSQALPHQTTSHHQTAQPPTHSHSYITLCFSLITSSPSLFPLPSVPSRHHPSLI